MTDATLFLRGTGTHKKTVDGKEEQISNYIIFLGELDYEVTEEAITFHLKKGAFRTEAGDNDDGLLSITLESPLDIKRAIPIMTLSPEKIPAKAVAKLRTVPSYDQELAAIPSLVGAYQSVEGTYPIILDFKAGDKKFDMTREISYDFGNGTTAHGKFGSPARKADLTLLPANGDKLIIQPGSVSTTVEYSHALSGGSIQLDTRRNVRTNLLSAAPKDAEDFKKALGTREYASSFNVDINYPDGSNYLGVVRSAKSYSNYPALKFCEELSRLSALPSVKDYVTGILTLDGGLKLFYANGNVFSEPVWIRLKANAPEPKSEMDEFGGSCTTTWKMNDWGLEQEVGFEFLTTLYVTDSEGKRGRAFDIGDYNVVPDIQHKVVGLTRETEVGTKACPVNSFVNLVGSANLPLPLIGAQAGKRCWISGGLAHEFCPVEAGAVLAGEPVSDGFSGMYSQLSIKIHEPAANGIALYEVVQTEHRLKRLDDGSYDMYSPEEGGDEDGLKAFDLGTVAYGYIGIGCNYIVQALFDEAKPFDGDKAEVKYGGVWKTLSKEAIKALDPFLQP